MQKSFSFMLVLFFFLLQACSPLGKPVDIEISDNFYYDKSESDIIYSSMGNWFELGETPLGADAETFDVLNAHLGKDKRNAYYKWYIIPSSEIDLKTFDASDTDWMWHIGMDQRHVFAFSDDVIDGEWQLVMRVIEGADPDTFKQTDYNWSRDKENHFYNYRIVNVEFDSFEVINETFARDSDSVYLHYQDRFESIDASASSFQMIDPYYARDGNHVYFYLDYANGKQIENLVKIPYERARTIKILEGNYLMVDNSVFYRGLPIEGVNHYSLKVLSSDFAKDESNVYYGNIAIEGADPKTFKYDDEKYVYRDQYRQYNHQELTKRTSLSTNDGEKETIQELSE